MWSCAEYTTSYRNLNRHVRVFVLRVNRASQLDDGQYACEGELFPQQAQTVHINSGEWSGRT